MTYLRDVLIWMVVLVLAVAMTATVGMLLYGIFSVMAETMGTTAVWVFGAWVGTAAVLAAVIRD